VRHLRLCSVCLAFVVSVAGCGGGALGLHETSRELLTHPDPAVRARAAKRLGTPRLFLGKCKCSDIQIAGECLEHLFKARSDDDPRVRAAAKRSTARWIAWKQSRYPRSEHNPRMEADAPLRSEGEGRETE
jgi:hypothetical protein